MTGPERRRRWAGTCLPLRAGRLADTDRRRRLAVCIAAATRDSTEMRLSDAIFVNVGSAKRRQRVDDNCSDCARYRGCTQRARATWQNALTDFRRLPNSILLAWPAAVALGGKKGFAKSLDELSGADCRRRRSTSNWFGCRGGRGVNQKAEVRHGRAWLSKHRIDCSLSVSSRHKNSLTQNISGLNLCQPGRIPFFLAAVFLLHVVGTTKWPPRTATSR